MVRAHLSSPLVFAALIAAAAPAHTQTADRTAALELGPLATTTIDSPFHRIGAVQRAGEEHGQFEVVSFDDTAFEVLRERHADGRPMTMRGFPMPGGLALDLELRPTRGMDDGAKAIVMTKDGSHELAPTVQLFTGHVRGRTSRVFLGISREILQGYVSLDDDTYFISSGSDVSERGSGLAYVARSDMFAGARTDAFCGVTEQQGATAGSAPTTAQRSAFGSNLRDTKPFLELDDSYRALFASDQAAIDYAVLLNAATSAIYRRDFSITLSLPNNYVRLWTETPPWGVTSSFGDLGKFGAWWKSPQNALKSINRSVVHMFTNPVFGGVAQGLGITCLKDGSFAISSVFGSFPSPVQYTSGSNWDLLVYSHETGHIYGSQHTFDYQPPIQCIDGSGPDMGTIMSYCHLDYGTGAVGMRFHSRVQDTIRTAIQSANCRVVTQLTPGDYDGDGVVDAADIMEFDAYVLQGFVSKGALDVFDLDGDGDADSADRNALVALQSGPPTASTWATIPGSGVNPVNTYQGVSNPVLGQVWRSAVTGYGPPKTTIVIVATDPLVPGVMTSAGELLIGMNGFGGQTLYTHLAPTAYSVAYHDILLPFEPALIGFKAYSQGGIFKSSGLELGYALELELSIFE